MADEYPLFPELPPGGAEEAQRLIDKFKGLISKAAEEVIGDLYVDVVPHIESDSWGNYRNHLMDGLRNYSVRNIQGDHDFKEIRQAIYREYRAEIIADLNRDLVEENESLKKQMVFMRECEQRRFG